MKYLIETELPLIAEEICVFPIKTKPQIFAGRFREINNDILLLTSEIDIKYPELSKYLDETPVAFSKSTDKEITITELENYLESLDTQLYNYFDTHELNTMLFNYVY
jgi:hypothetical protein